MTEQETSGQPNGAGVAVARRQAALPLSQRDPVKLAQHFAQSGYFKDASDLSKAVVKIVAGEELGLGPMASMSGIHIIEGKPSLSANLLATQVKRHPAYDYRPLEVSDQGARIEFFQHGESIGVSEFTLAEAQQAGIAGKQNFKRYPKAMMFARALSQGVRWFCPDVTAGSPAYVPEELGAEVTAEGEPIVVTQAPEPVAEEVDAEVVDDNLDPERVAKIISGFGALKLNYADIDLLLGSVGIDGLRAKSAKAVEERIASLDPDQADIIEAELQGMGDDGK